MIIEETRQYRIRQRETAENPRCESGVDACPRTSRITALLTPSNRQLVCVMSILEKMQDSRRIGSDQEYHRQDAAG